MTFDLDQGIYVYFISSRETLTVSIEPGIPRCKVNIKKASSDTTSVLLQTSN